MNTTDHIRSFLQPAGKTVISFVEDDIAFLKSHIRSDESVESATTGSKKLTTFLYLLTSERLLTLEKVKNGMTLVSYDLEDITNLIINRKLLSVEINFVYLKSEVKIKLNNDNATKHFADELENLFGIPEKGTPQNKVKGPKPIKTYIDILNGKDQLKDKGSLYKLLQTKKGEVEITVDYHNTPEVFKLIKWERVENIQKSAFDIAGWSLIGSTFGNAGSIAGAMGANIGKDKSVATLYLKRLNGEKVALVIKCDKKVLEKLSMLIVAEEEESNSQSGAPVQLSTADEIIKFKQLLDEGILTQDEFDAKKKQLLGI